MEGVRKFAPSAHLDVNYHPLYPESRDVDLFLLYPLLKAIATHGVYIRERRRARRTRSEGNNKVGTGERRLCPGRDREAVGLSSIERSCA
jgi:hypothetical protein